MALDEPSSSLAHLQSRQRLAWAAGLHPRLGGASPVIEHLNAVLHSKIGQRPPVVQPWHIADDTLVDARTSTTRGAVRGDARGVQAWHVARAARSLHLLPLCFAVGSDPTETREYRWIVDRLVARLMGWHAQFSGQPSSAHFFNKASFMHEMEEVLLPLRVLVAMRDLSPLPAEADPPAELHLQPPREHAPEPSLEPERIIVVDLCAGKGFLPMCLAHGAVAVGSDRVQPVAVEISRVLLLEKARVNWAHLRDSGSWAPSARESSPEVEIWGPPHEKLNIFDEALIERLAQLPGKLMLVGIHLCRCVHGLPWVLSTIHASGMSCRLIATSLDTGGFRVVLSKSSTFWVRTKLLGWWADQRTYLVTNSSAKSDVDSCTVHTRVCTVGSRAVLPTDCIRHHRNHFACASQR